MHDQRVAFPAADRFAVVARHHQVGIAVLAPVEEDRAHRVVEARDHVDRGRQLDERVRPDAGHQHRHARRVALADRVAVGLAARLRLGRLDQRLDPLGPELRIGRAEHVVGETLRQVDEPGAGHVERRRWARLSEVFGSERAEVAGVLGHHLLEPLGRDRGQRPDDLGLARLGGVARGLRQRRRAGQRDSHG